MDIGEAMERVVDIADGAALMEYLRRHFDYWNPTEDNVSIRPYGYDGRVQWDTHLICIDGKAALFSDGPIPHTASGEQK